MYVYYQYIILLYFALLGAAGFAERRGLNRFDSRFFASMHDGGSCLSLVVLPRKGFIRGFPLP